MTGGQEKVVFAWRASLAMSTRTGPGRPVEAMWKACAMTRGDVLGLGDEEVGAGDRHGDADDVQVTGHSVFFYDDITHVGVYIGNGMKIHAPKPGTYVREESIFDHGEPPIDSVVRPAWAPARPGYGLVRRWTR
ncbi:hypothetical protein SHIRM173S_08893 [Streptomyces hirsutus]